MRRNQENAYVGRGRMGAQKAMVTDRRIEGEDKNKPEGETEVLPNVRSAVVVALSTKLN